MCKKSTKAIFLAIVIIACGIIGKVLYTKIFVSPESTQKKILCLGDSFTVGTGLGKGLEGDAFPFQLVAHLKQMNYDVATPKLYAVDGDTTKHLLGALNTAEPLSNPDNVDAAPDKFDLVILAVGINDLFRGHSVEDYAHHFAELLNRAIRFARNDPSRVIVLSIPAWDVSPSVTDGGGTKFRENKYEAVRNSIAEISIPITELVATDDGYKIKDTSLVTAKIARSQSYNTRAGIAKEIDSFNSAAKAAIEKTNAPNPKEPVNFFDLTPLTRDEVEKSGNRGQFFAADGIHYSKEMYGKWVSLILPKVKEIMDAPTPLLPHHNNSSNRHANTDNANNDGS